MWLLHLPQWLTTSAINNQLAITSANNIQWLSTKKVTITSVTKTTKSLAQIQQQMTNMSKFWQNNHPKL